MIGHVSSNAPAGFWNPAAIPRAARNSSATMSSTALLFMVNSVALHGELFHPCFPGVGGCAKPEDRESDALIRAPSDPVAAVPLRGEEEGAASVRRRYRPERAFR